MIIDNEASRGVYLHNHRVYVNLSSVYFIWLVLHGTSIVYMYSIADYKLSMITLLTITIMPWLHYAR